MFSHIGTEPRYREDAIYGALPVAWVGTAAIDITKNPWQNAPLGSMYFHKNVDADTGQWYTRVARAAANADWESLDGTAYSP